MGDCVAGLACVEGQCVEIDCELGELDCGCNDFECLPGLDCVAGSCIPEPEGGDDTPGLLDCMNLDPNRVYIYGTYRQGQIDQDALAEPSAPRRSCPGFSNRVLNAIIRPTDGRLIYYDYTDNDGFHVFVPDPLVWESGEWFYPTSPAENDGLIPTPGCQLISPYFAMNPITGKIVYSCDGRLSHENGELIADLIGALPLAVLANDNVLLCSDECRSNTLNEIHPDGSSTSVVHPGTGDEMILTTRHGPNGLWLAVDTPLGDARWLLVDGVVVDEGLFATPGTNLGPSPVDQRLDAEGNLWQRIHLVTDDAIARRPLADEGPSEVVYNEADAPESPNFHHWPFVYMHSSFVLSGP